MCLYVGFFKPNIKAVQNELPLCHGVQHVEYNIVSLLILEFFSDQILS